jgi:hypothetical protein
MEPRLRRSRISAGQCGDPTIQQLAAVHEQAPNTAIKDEAGLCSNPPRRPIADCRPPPDDI